MGMRAFTWRRRFHALTLVPLAVGVFRHTSLLCETAVRRHLNLCTLELAVHLPTYGASEDHSDRRRRR
jgi:hypothetical protein